MRPDMGYGAWREQGVPRAERVASLIDDDDLSTPDDVEPLVLRRVNVLRRATLAIVDLLKKQQAS